MKAEGCNGAQGGSIGFESQEHTLSERVSFRGLYQGVAAPSAVNVRLENKRVVVGSNEVLCVDVYSDTLRKPKKAVRRAANNMSLSS